MSNIKLVVFDLDQTLVDSSSLSRLRSERNWRKIYELIHEATPFAGIQRLITSLKNMGLKKGMVTSAPRPYAERIINFQSWYFESTICYHDTWLHKPNPEPFTKLINDTNLQCNDLISVGDDPRDIIASKKAGIRSIAATWGALDKGKLIDSEPDYIAESPEEILNFL